MKRFVFIAICVLGLLSFSSCRSTSNPCGLAENSTKPTKQLQQPTVLVISSEMA
tara:strand:- start:11287 stop:11448 length:162 start_codon:yes stop_codon:yes gene_type:complete